MKAKYVFIVMLIALIVLLLPLSFRTLQGNGSIIGEQSYFHLGIAQNTNDPGAYPLPNVLPNLFHFIIAEILLFIHPSLIAKALPIFLGVVNTALFYMVLRKNSIDVHTAGLASIFLSISSLFIIIHSTLQPYSLLLSIGLLAAFVFTFSPRWSAPITLLAISVDILGFFVLCASLLVLALPKKKTRVILATFLAGIVLSGVLWLVKGFVALNQFSTTNTLASFLSTFGSGFGFSSFIIILAIIGLVSSWSKQNRVIFAIIIGCAVFIYSFFEPVARALILPFVILYAAKGGLAIIYRPWSVSSIRILTLFMIALSILFGAVMTVNGLVHAEPSLTKIQAMNFLKTSDQSEVVLSSVDNGIFIQRIAGRKAFLDSISADNQSLETAQIIFNSVRIKDAEGLLQRNNITHILIDQEMMDGGVWTQEEQGLLFLVENTHRFVNVFEKGDVKIYRFVD